MLLPFEAPLSNPADDVPDISEYHSINGVKVDEIVKVCFLYFGEIEVPEQELCIGLGKLSDLFEQVVCVVLSLFTNYLTPLRHLNQYLVQVLVAGTGRLLYGGGFAVLADGLAPFQGF